MASESKNSLIFMRVDHIGSLLRPAKLQEAIIGHKNKLVSDEELRKAQDEAIRDVIAKQEAHGLPVVNDGEFRRLTFQDSFISSVSGFRFGSTTLSVVGDSEPGSVEEASNQYSRRPVTDRLSFAKNQPLAEYLFVRSVAKRPVKVTVLSPDRISQRFDLEKSRAVYSNKDEFLADVVAIERRLVSDLVEAGCRYIQIDAPSYTAYADPRLLQEMRDHSEDPMVNLERSIKADNAIIEGFPEVTFGIHLCRGNRPGGERRQGSYDAIAERLFTNLRHDRILLEYDSDRAGGFEPLRLIPKGKVAVLGLITTKEARLETLHDLKRRIDQASKFLPLDQLALSPQCGFSGGAIGRKVTTEEVQWRKIDRMVEVAAEVWN